MSKLPTQQEQEAFQKMHSLAQITVRESNGHFNTFKDQVIGRLMTFLESIGGTPQELKARKDMLYIILSEINDGMYDNNNYLGKQLDEWITWYKAQSPNTGSTFPTDWNPYKEVKEL